MIYRDKYKKTGLARLRRAFVNSMNGLYKVYLTEAAFRQEVWIVTPLACIAIVFGRSYLETVILLTVLILVLVIELINSAIEVVVDRIGLEENELSGFAKDIGSTSVFITILLALVVWLLFLFDLLKF